MADERPAKNEDSDRANAEGNTCIGLGVGVGALGAGAAVISGVVCPLCYIVPPVLIAAGAIKKRQSKRKCVTQSSDS